MGIILTDTTSCGERKSWVFILLLGESRLGSNACRLSLFQKTDGYLHNEPCRKISTSLQTVCTSNDVSLTERVLRRT
jgi:hypothetical protein